MRSDRVHRRESAGKEPVVLKVARVKGAACSGTVTSWTITYIFMVILLKVIYGRRRRNRQESRK